MRCTTAFTGPTNRNPSGERPRMDAFAWEHAMCRSCSQWQRWAMRWRYTLSEMKSWRAYSARTKSSRDSKGRTNKEDGHGRRTVGNAGGNDAITGDRDRDGADAFSRTAAADAAGSGDGAEKPGSGEAEPESHKGCGALVQGSGRVLGIESSGHRF